MIGKQLERLIKDHLVDFLVKINLLNSSQHGLDFKKAFDKVPHQRLLLKLKAHGIGNGMINWIEKLLIDRRQRVVV